MAFESEMLTTTAAAEIAGVDGRLIRTWIAQRKLPAMRREDGIWLIEPADLDAHLARRRQRPRGPRRRRTTIGEQLVARALLELEGEPATVDELALLIDRHPGNVRKYLLLLAAAGHAERRAASWMLTTASDDERTGCSWALTAAGRAAHQRERAA